MKIPSRALLAALVAAFAIPVAFAQSPLGGSSSSTTRKVKAKKTGARTQALADSLRRMDSIQIADSLRIDSTHFADSLRADSVDRARAKSKATAPARRLDSLLRPDTVRRVDFRPLAAPSASAGVPGIPTDSARTADSLRKVDSVALVAGTWFVARPRNFAQSPELVVQLQNKLGQQLRRTGNVRRVLDTDTNSSFMGTWTAARASGASKMLYVAVYSGASGGCSAVAWHFDLSDGRKIDSSRAENSGSTERIAGRLARDLVGSLLPTREDSLCRADSTALARVQWAVAEPRNWTADSGATRSVRDSLIAGLRRSHRLSWRALVVADTGCHKRHCIDSAAALAGVGRVVHSVLARTADSTWVLSLWVARAGDDGIVDTLRVADLDVSRLGARALSELVPATPRTCRDSCPSPDTRTIWSFQLSSDSASRALAQPLAASLKDAFRARKDRQFLSLPDPLIIADTLRLDSIARSLGVRRLLVLQLSGTDSSRTLLSRSRDLRTGARDSLVLSRSGIPARVVPWFAKHLVSAGDSLASPCGEGCHSDSLRRSQVAWALVPTVEMDSVPGKPLTTELSNAFATHAAGRLVALPATLPCGDLPCLDSLAATLSIRKLVWPTVSRQKDSSLVLSAWISDVASDLWTDTVELRDTGSLPAAFDRLSGRLWDSLSNRRPCDSCLVADTLEAAAAVAWPEVSGAADILRTAFRDTVSRILSHEGTYRILDPLQVDSLATVHDTARLSRLRCRLGAVFLVKTGAVLEKKGWHVTASLQEISTGRVLRSVDIQDQSSAPERPLQLAPRVGRELLGDTTAAQPSAPVGDSAKVQPPAADKGIPWFKIIALAIPLLIGTISVIAHM